LIAQAYIESPHPLVLLLIHIILILRSYCRTTSNQLT